MDTPTHLYWPRPLDHNLPSESWREWSSEWSLQYRICHVPFMMSHDKLISTKSVLVSVFPFTVGGMSVSGDGRIEAWHAMMRMQAVRLSVFLTCWCIERLDSGHHTPSDLLDVLSVSPHTQTSQMCTRDGFQPDQLSHSVVLLYKQQRTMRPSMNTERWTEWMWTAIKP